MLCCSGARPAFEHSNFFKVNVPATPGTQLRAPGESREEGQDGSARLTADRRPERKIQLRAFQLQQF